jgi:hypothetical protein
MTYYHLQDVQDLMWCFQQARAQAYKRTLTAGRSLSGQLVAVLRFQLQEIGTWLLCVVMYGIESVKLRNWLTQAGPISSRKA